MAITSLAGYLAAPRYRVEYQKNAGSLVTGALLGSLWSGAGNHTAGSLSIGDTTSGLVPTSATTGAINLPSFSGTGYISGVEFSVLDTSENGSQVYWLYDRLYHAGSFSGSVGTTNLSSQPSYSSRVPGGDYTGLEVFAEVNGSASSAATLNITYTDQSGNNGHTSPSITTASSSTTPRLYRIPYASGDCGIQKLESFVVSSSGAGSPTWNIVIARRLCRVFVNAPGDQNDTVLWIDRTGARQIYNNSCLWLAGISNGTPVLNLVIEIAAG